MGHDVTKMNIFGYLGGGGIAMPGGGLQYASPPPYGRASRVCDSLLARKYGRAGGRGFAPGRGNSKESVSSNQETGKVFFPEMPFYSKF